MINKKVKILIVGVFAISIISIIFAIVLNTKKFGAYIAFFDMFSIAVWLLIGNYIFKHKNYE